MISRVVSEILGQSQRAAMPRRVRRVIAAREADSERLIGWVQLLVVSIFAALYAVAPKPLDAEQHKLEYVPLILGGYLLFTITRLSFSYWRPLPPPLVVLSMLVDVSLLMGLIWSFHLQYGQPAAFYLKVPTFVYIYIFISLRALRFDPRYVLATGIFAAIGWLFMLGYALHASPREMVTRNFVDYMTGNLILLGAEFDKVATILVVTLLMALAVTRARGTLITAVSEESAGRDMRRFFSQGVAEAITGAEREFEAGQAEARDAAILMLDIRGFTGFAATRPPEEVVRILTGLHSRVLPIVRRHGGAVDKFLGDGIMATFGAVMPDVRAAAKAMEAVDEIMGETRRWANDLVAEGVEVPLTVNAGVAAGPVVVATLGSEERLEYTVIGSAANLAAKLEKHNKREASRALTDAASFRLAESQGYRPALEPERRDRRAVEGLDEPRDLVVLAA